MAGSRREDSARQVFANTVASVSRLDQFVSISFGLQATHGLHAGQITPVLMLALTSECASVLADLLMGRPHE